MTTVMRKSADWQRSSLSALPKVNRAFVVEFDVKKSRRIVEGRAVPYGTPTMVADLVQGRPGQGYLEEWEAGVFRSYAEPANAGRVAFQLLHDEPDHKLNRIGRTLRMVEEEDGLYGEWRVHDTDGGDWVLGEMAAGKLTGLSISARIRETVQRAQVQVRRRAILEHVALVPKAAYADAMVLQVREQLVDQGPAPVPSSRWAAELERMKATRRNLG